MIYSLEDILNLYRNYEMVISINLSYTSGFRSEEV